MRKLTRKILVVVSLIMVFSNISNAQVSINKDGSAPIYSSILHVKGDATNKNIIFEPGASGRVGIGTSYPSHKLTIKASPSDSSVLRLIGPDGVGYGARLNFGDANYIYIEEDNDDKLTIYADKRTAIMGGNVGIGTPNPENLLHLYKAASDNWLDIRTDSGKKSGVRFRERSSDEYGFDIYHDGTDNLLVIEGIENGGVSNGKHIVVKRYNGNVGIGTTDPGTKLEVAGQVKITGGIPGDGKVLTSDANGLASWQTQSPNVGDYGTVTNPATGKTWLDRNLGASQVATSSTDAAAYGDLYQWGRAQEGHENRYSATTTTKATTWIADEDDNVWDMKYIKGSNDWLNTASDDLWKGTDAENNPCPSGFRIPTNAEWNQERRTWATQDAAGAFGSVLKLSVGGDRYFDDGSLYHVGTRGYYWSSTATGIYARYLYFGDVFARMTDSFRSTGISVRCIED